MVEKRFDFSSNAFDVISLFAAINVAVAHLTAWTFCNGQGGALWFWRLIAPGPAVALIFTISGYLCAASYERIKTPWKFYVKRIARIYPALILVVLIPSLMFCIIGLIPFDVKTFIPYLVKKVVFAAGNSYEPNGAVGDSGLWTIFRQMQFYALTPFIIWMFKRMKHIIRLVVLILFVFLNIFSNSILNGLGGVFRTIYGMSCLPYIYMYILGVLIYLHKERIIPFLSKNAYYFGMLYVIFHWILGIDRLDIWYYVNPISAILLVLTMFGLSYKFGKKRLKYDISYGVYLWHIPCLDFLRIVCSLQNKWVIYIGAWILTFGIAWLSYRFVETPVSGFVNNQLRRFE